MVGSLRHISPFFLCRRYHEKCSAQLHTLWVERLKGFQVYLHKDELIDDQYRAPLNRLPSEILLMIFANVVRKKALYYCTLVCRQWASHAVSHLWRRIECKKVRSWELICRTLNCESTWFTYRDFTRHLILDGLSLAEVALSAAGFPSLQELEVYKCEDLSDDGLIALAPNSPHLLQLQITHNDHITGRSIATIVKESKKLKSLVFEACRNISSESLSGVVENCRWLQEVRLSTPMTKDYRQLLTIFPLDQPRGRRY